MTITESFAAAMRYFDETNPSPGPKYARKLHATRRALFAAMWLIENVTDDDAGRTEIFFVVRGLARDAAAD